MSTSLSFLNSMKGGGRLAFYSVRISYQYDGISFFSCIHGERTGRLVMRTGFGNQSNGYVGTTLCLSSLLMTEMAIILTYH